MKWLEEVQLQVRGAGFRHVQKKKSGDVVQRILNIELLSRGESDWPQRRFMDVVKEDM